jgi:RES domain-containing protein
VSRSPRPPALIDALDSRQAMPFSGVLWRVVTSGFDPLRPGRSGGRWDDGSFDVLYTAAERDGALAEAHFHAYKGQPVLPSKISKSLHQIEANLARVLDLTADGVLAEIGADMVQYGRLHYVERESEYPSLQQIAEVAFFLEFEGILVPNARWSCANLVVFNERIRPDQLIVTAKEPVDLAKWHRAVGGRQGGASMRLV